MSKIQAANDYPDITSGHSDPFLYPGEVKTEGHVDLMYYPGEERVEVVTFAKTATDSLLDAVEVEAERRLWELSQYTDEELETEQLRRKPS